MKSYKIEEVLEMGLENFLKEVSPKEPLEIPDLEFTEEENQRMDELLKQD